MKVKIYFRAFFALVLAIAFTASYAYSEEKYVFERMWPTLQQPWYFWPVQDAAVDSHGYIYFVTGHEGYRGYVLKFTSDGEFITKWETYQNIENAIYSDPSAIAIDSYDNIYILDRNSNNLKVFKSNGEFLIHWGGVNGDFDRPQGLAIDNIGRIYVADTYNHRIQVFDNQGNYIEERFLQDQEGNAIKPVEILVDSEGFAYVSYDNYDQVQKIDSNGQLVMEGWGCTECAIATDNEGYIYTNTSEVRKYSNDGN